MSYNWRQQQPAYGHGQQQYGYGQQQPQQHQYAHAQQQQQPPVSSRNPPPSGRKGEHDHLIELFRQIDKDGNGTLDAMELQNALSNGSWKTPFNPETIRLMIAMFDKTGTGTIAFNEFGALWKYIDDWRSTFIRFDTDRSGAIDCGELKQCLTAFGYRLSERFFQMAITRFDRTKQGSIFFDDFVQLCVMLQTLTAAFRTRDVRRKGQIVVTYEDFLLMVFNARI